MHSGAVCVQPVPSDDSLHLLTAHSVASECRVNVMSIPCIQSCCMFGALDACWRCMHWVKVRAICKYSLGWDIKVLVLVMIQAAGLGFRV